VLAGDTRPHTKVSCHILIAPSVQLVGVQVAALDESLGQHQGWTSGLCVWDWQAFRRCHRRTSIARWSSA
jgi:hypothetical protein